MRTLQLYSLAIVLGGSALQSYAEKIVEYQGALEIDWSTAKIRQSSRVNSSKPEFLWSDLDADARRQGLLHLKEKVIELSRNAAIADGVVEVNAQAQAQLAGKIVETTTWLKNTEYDPSGRLTHHFENRLSRALIREDFKFLSEDISAEISPFTGLVFRVKNEAQPSGVYKIVDENSELLMGLNQIHKSAFDERLMGRWYRNPSRQEVSRVVGRRPLSIEVEYVSPGVFKMPAGRWKEAVANHQKLVQDVRIMIALPEKQS